MGVAAVRSRGDRSLLVTVPCAVALLLLLAVGGPVGERPWAVALCAAVVLLIECFPLHFAVSGERHTATFVELPMTLGLVLSPGRLLTLGLMAAVLVAQLFRRLPLRKAAFNVSQYGLAAAVGSLVAVHWAGTAGVLAGLALFTLVNEMAVQLVLLAVAGVALGVPYRGAGRLWLLHLSVSLSGGLVLGKALEQAPELLFAMVAPLLLLLHSQRESLRRSTAETVHRSIAEHALRARPIDGVDTMKLITDLARDLLAAERAELLIIDGPRPMLCRADSGGTSRQRLPESWLQPGTWYEDCLSAGRAGTVRGNQALVALADESGTRALLTVYRRPEDEAFRLSDLPALESLGAAATDWVRTLQEAPAPVVDLDRVPRQTAPRPDVLRLVQELDVLASKVRSEGGAPLPEVDEMHELLLASLATDGRDLESEPRIAVGSWHGSSRSRL